MTVMSSGGFLGRVDNFLKFQLAHNSGQSLGFSIQALELSHVKPKLKEVSRTGMACFHQLFAMKPFGHDMFDGCGINGTVLWLCVWKKITETSDGSGM